MQYHMTLQVIKRFETTFRRGMSDLKSCLFGHFFEGRKSPYKREIYAFRNKMALTPHFVRMKGVYASRIACQVIYLRLEIFFGKRES